MRTKADALANPLMLDQWKTGRLERKVYCQVNGKDVGVLTRGSGRLPTTEVLTERAFRRWAANAEYLGGTNE